MTAMPATARTTSPETLLAKLSALGIVYTNHHHAPVMTVDDSRAMRGAIAGLHVKNLFLKDKKGGLWLIVAEETQPIDLKSLRKRLGVSNLSFGKPEALMAALGVTPGSVTPFGVINDPDAAVRVVLDQRLSVAAQVSFHPLDNAQNTTISGAGLLTFLDALDHAPLVLDFAQEDALAEPSPCV